MWIWNVCKLNALNCFKTHWAILDVLTQDFHWFLSIVYFDCWVRVFTYFTLNFVSGILEWQLINVFHFDYNSDKIVLFLFIFQCNSKHENYRHNLRTQKTSLTCTKDIRKCKYILDVRVYCFTPVLLWNMANWRWAKLKRECGIAYSFWLSVECTAKLKVFVWKMVFQKSA